MGTFLRDVMLFRQVVGWGMDLSDETLGPPGSRIKAIAAGDVESIALKEDGSIISWGAWEYTDSPGYSSPTGKGHKAIATKTSIHLALTADGHIAQWGHKPSYDNFPPPTEAGFTAIAAGDAWGLAIKADGSIAAWGANAGEAGYPTTPPAGTDFIAIGAGDLHCVALKSDGSLVQWGNADYWGGADYSTLYPLPDPNTGFIAIAVGRRHNIALKSDGSVVCWGSNWYGETTLPDPNTDFIAIAAGYGFKSIGLKKNGSIVAWGAGEGTTEITSPAGTGYTKIAAGIGYNFTIKADGSIAGWGIDKNGQANYPSGTDFVAIAAGGMHGLALKSNGSMVGWGSNNYGQASCPSGTDYKYISAGYKHSIALKTDNSTIIGFGDNSAGQLDNLPPPSDNQGTVIYDMISAGRYHNLAIHHHVNDPDVSPMGHIVGNGNNDSGQVSPVPSEYDFIDVSAGGAHSLALKSDGHIYAWGNNDYGQTNCPSGAGYLKISAGRRCSLAIAADGSIEGWGDNSNGQIDDIPVLEVGNVFVDISAGGNNCAALKADGTIVTWGYAGYTGTTYPKGNNFKAIAAGTEHCLALKSVFSVKDVFYDPVKKKHLIARCAKCSNSAAETIEITFSGIIHKEGGRPWPVIDGVTSDPNRTFTLGRGDPEYTTECELLWTWGGDSRWSAPIDGWRLLFTYGNHYQECVDLLSEGVHRALTSGQIILYTYNNDPQTDAIVFETHSAVKNAATTFHAVSGNPTVDICSGRRTLLSGGRFRDRITTIVRNGIRASDTEAWSNGYGPISGYGGQAVVNGGALFADGPGFH